MGVGVCGVRGYHGVEVEDGGRGNRAGEKGVCVAEIAAWGEGTEG